MNPNIILASLLLTIGVFLLVVSAYNFIFRMNMIEKLVFCGGGLQLIFSLPCFILGIYIYKKYSYTSYEISAFILSVLSILVAGFLFLNGFLMATGSTQLSYERDHETGVRVTFSCIGAFILFCGSLFFFYQERAFELFNHLKQVL